MECLNNYQKNVVPFLKHPLVLELEVCSLIFALKLLSALIMFRSTYCVDHEPFNDYLRLFKPSKQD